MLRNSADQRAQVFMNTKYLFSCLWQVIVSSHQELRCPECRIVVETKIDELPSNILLIRILEGKCGFPFMEFPGNLLSSGTNIPAD